MASIASTTAEPALRGTDAPRPFAVSQLVLPAGRRHLRRACSSLPTVASLFFSLTRWNFQSATFIGLDNFHAVLPRAKSLSRA